MTPKKLKQSFEGWIQKNLKKKVFWGMSLGGGKSSNSCIAKLEFYPKQKKIFLRELNPNFKSNSIQSADSQIVEYWESEDEDVEAVAIDVALSYPKCLRCKLTCPGMENCNQSEIKWMWSHFKKNQGKRKPAKLFTPYTERCTERYVSTELEENFNVGHALGANMAPLFARAKYLTRQMSGAHFIEYFPKLSLWRIGRSLNVQKSYLRFHKHSVDGDETRQAILDHLIKKDIAFIYDQDYRLMVEKPQAFEAFLGGLTAILKSQGQVEKKPKGFPKQDGWIEIPNKSIQWF